MTRRFPVLQTYSYLLGARDFVDFGGYNYHSTFPEGREGNSMWVDRDEHQQLGKKFMDKVLEDRRFAFLLVSDCYKLCDDLVNESREISNVNFSDATDCKLEEIFSHFMNSYMKLTRYMLTPHFVELALSDAIKKWLSEKIHDKDEVEQSFTIISVPSKETNSTKEQKSLLHIASEVKKLPSFVDRFIEGSVRPTDLDLSSSEIGKMIENHTERFAWMPMVCMINTPRGEQQYLDMISDILRTYNNPIQRLETIEKHVEEQRKMTKSTIRSLNMPEDIAGYVKTLQDFIFLRTFRMETYGQAHYYVQPLFAEISKKSNLTTQEIKYLTHLEIMNFLGTGSMISKREIKERMIAYAFVMRNRIVSEIFAGKEAEDLKKKELVEVSA